jgi:sec-independent protein translocase protein TatA
LWLPATQKSEEKDKDREAKMGEFSIYHWLIVLVVVLLLFGGRKIPELMRGIGDGIRSFREGVKGDGEKPVGKDR